MELKEVFEPVLNFIKNLQKKDKEQTSKQAAKDRLKLVLMQDRASVSPDFFEMMKKEIIDVIKKYIEIDEEALEVQLTRGIEAGLEGPALYANIPIKNVKPVAPKSESDNDETLSEEEAEIAAENILTSIEAATNTAVAEAETMQNTNQENDEEKAKEDAVEEEENIDKENIKQEDASKENDETSKPKEEKKKTTAKRSSKTSTATKKTTRKRNS